MPNTRIGTEYAAQKKILDNAVHAGVCTGLSDLKRVLGPDGPDRTHAGVLDAFREVSLKFNEADRIMEAAGLNPAGREIPADDGVRKAALLKFLRHLYMVGARGSQQVWVLSTPAAYTNFPQDEILSANFSNASIKAKLTDVAEKFDADVRKRLGEATQLGLAWVEAAKVVLASVSSDPKSVAILRRWFGSAASTDAELVQTAGVVLAGFKKMASSLNQNLIVITDMPKYRADTSKDAVEAFILASDTAVEMPRAIYIERGLFNNFEMSALNDMKKNWARVHRARVFAHRRSHEGQPLRCQWHRHRRQAHSGEGGRQCRQLGFLRG